MKKYPSGKLSCEAVYDNAHTGNPLLAAMPELLPREEFMKAIRNMPGLPHNLNQMSKEERRQNLSTLSSVFIPMDYMYAIYDQLYRAVRETYTTRTIINEIKQINAIFCGEENLPFAVQAISGSILGVPGIGKTSSICQALATMPRVIEHTQYMGQPFFCKQVLYLKVECPSDCSIKTLAFNLITALDQAIGSDYLHELGVLRASASSIATQVKILCMTHHVGLLLVDEIQNAVITAKKNHRVKPLIRFLVELTNDTSTSVFFIGTPAVEDVFVSQEHLKRRTRGIRLLPLKPDGTYRRFLEQLWFYQFTPTAALLSEKLANKLYDFSGGIPAYIVKIFQESQAQALLRGQKQIDVKTMQAAIDLLAIRIPKTYSGGIHISDFEVIVSEVELDGFSEHHNSDKPRDLLNSVMPGLLEAPEISFPEPRLYANQRGRKADARDDDDLIIAFQSVCDMVPFLRKNHLLEEWEMLC